MKETRNGYVKTKRWDFDDEYLIVEVQVSSENFKRGDIVKVTVEKAE